MERFVSLAACALASGLLHGCQPAPADGRAPEGALWIYPNRFDAFFTLSEDPIRDLSMTIPADAYAEGDYEIDFADENPGPYDDDEHGFVTEYSPDCTPCQWAVLSGTFRASLSEIADGDANTWSFSLDGEDLVVAPRESSGAVDLEAAEPLADSVRARGEAFYYVVPPDTFSPTHVASLTPAHVSAEVLDTFNEGDEERVIVRGRESESGLVNELDGWEVYLDLPRALISTAGSVAVTSSSEGMTISARFVADDDGWERHFLAASATLVVDTPAAAIGDPLTLRLTGVDFADSGDLYLPAGPLHVTFDTIELNATLQMQSEH